MIDFIVLALATWRIASLLAAEDGPYSVFAKIRRDVGVRYDQYSNPYAETELARGLMCVWCNSVWIGFIGTFLYLLNNDWTIILAFPFALSAGAVLVETITGGEGES